MSFDLNEKVKYGNNTVTVIGIISAFFEVGSFPEGTTDIDIKYRECGFDKGKVPFDTVLINVKGNLIRVALNAIEKQEQKSKASKKSKKEKK